MSTVIVESAEDIGRAIEAERLETLRDLWGPYDAMLQAMAAGKPIDTKQAAQLMDQLGYDTAKVNQDLELLKDRLSRRAQYEQLAASQAKSQKALDEHSRLSAELQATVERLQPQIAAKLQEHKAAETEVGIAEAAARRLRDTIRNPVLAHELAEHGKELRAVTGRLRAIDDQLTRHSGTPVNELELAEAKLADAGPNTHPTTLADCKARIQRATEAIKRLEAEQAELQKQRAKLEAKGKLLEQQKLVP